MGKKRKAKKKARDVGASFKRSGKSHAEQQVFKTVASTTCKRRAVTFLDAFISDIQTGTSTRPLREGKGLTHSSSDARERDTVLRSSSMGSSPAL